MPADTLRGTLCVVTAALLWGASGTVGKLLFTTGITPFELVQARVVLAALALALFIGLRHPSQLRLYGVADSIRLLLLGLVMATVQITYFYSISKINVAAAILLQYMAPVLIAGVSFTLWGEKVTAPKLTALALSLGGCYLVVGAYDLNLLQQNRTGILAGLGSALSFASYSLLGEKGMHRRPPTAVLFYALSIAGIVLHLIYPPFNPVARGLDAHQVALILYVGILGTAVPFGLYLAGINYLRSTRASIVGTLEPITAGVLSFLLLGEAFAPLQLLGAAAVLGGIALLQLSREEDPLTPARLRAQKAAAPCAEAAVSESSPASSSD